MLIIPQQKKDWQQKSHKIQRFSKNSQSQHLWLRWLSALIYTDIIQQTILCFWKGVIFSGVFTAPAFSEYWLTAFLYTVFIQRTDNALFPKGGDFSGYSQSLHLWLRWLSALIYTAIIQQTMLCFRKGWFFQDIHSPCTYGSADFSSNIYWHHSADNALFLKGVIFQDIHSPCTYGSADFSSNIYCHYSTDNALFPKGVIFQDIHSPCTYGYADCQL